MRFVVLVAAIISCGYAATTIAHGAELVEFRLELVDERGNVSDTFDIGADIFLNVYGSDLRLEPFGVFAAYLDVEFNAALVTPVWDDFAFGPAFGSVPRSGRSNQSMLDEAGSVLNSFANAGEVQSESEQLLFTARFTAESPGEGSFLGNPADVLPLNATLLLGDFDAVTADEMRFIDAPITIVPEPGTSVLVVTALLFLLSARRTNNGLAAGDRRKMNH